MKSGRQVERLAFDVLGAKLEKTAAGLVSRRTFKEFPGNGFCFLCNVGVVVS